jgi:SAM-dependent methyltransferase
MTHRTADEQAFFDEINASLPQGKDWKQGAMDYVQSIVKAEGSHNELYMLSKPFMGGDDHHLVARDIHFFGNLLGLLKPNRTTRILDVGCGSGWTTYFFAKCGFRVVGIDISNEMLWLGQRRFAADPFTPYPNTPFNVGWMLHDIGESPVPGGETFDWALFEATLHHFLDPVQTLKNAAQSLTPEGLLIINEGTAPGLESAWHKENVRLMDQYATLERPFSRSQMDRMLQLAGFTHYRRFHPVNGYFEQSSANALTVSRELRRSTESNFMIASRSKEAIDRLFPPKTVSFKQRLKQAIRVLLN